MNPSIYVTPPAVQLPEPALGSGHPELVHLLRQTLDVQREQLAVLRAQAAAQDGLARWRAFLARWQTDFPDIGLSCKLVLPIVERAYLNLIKELTDRLREEDGGLDDDYVLGEFLDRYGMRLNQLATILGQLAPLADAAPVPEADQT